jgi:hypothetical protein
LTKGTKQTEETEAKTPPTQYYLDQLELLVAQENSRVFKFLAKHERNIFGFSFFIYQNNKDDETPICHFNNTWNTIKWSTHRREFYLGDLVNEISTWNTSPTNNVTSFADLPINETLRPTPENEQPSNEQKDDSDKPDSDREKSNHSNRSSWSTPVSNLTVLFSI